MSIELEENIEDLKAPLALVEDFIENVLQSSDNDIDGQLIKQDEISLSLKKNFNSLEDLVKTFDSNVKECFSNYKNIDIGQLAPVQVRTQEDLINDSQMWYTLTGNFGNFLPINFSSEIETRPSLVKKYHTKSLDLKNFNNKKCSSLNNSDFDEENDSDEVDDYLEFDENESQDDFDEQVEDEDEELLKEQLDMHSIILIKNLNNDLDEPLITAEQVLNEIDSMMNLQEEEFLDEMTPDSGVYSVACLNTSLNSSINLNENNSNSNLTLDMNEISYLKYINTFAEHTNKINELKIDNNGNFLYIPCKQELKKLNTFELNDLIEQIENQNRILSELLIDEFALREELDFEKETRNTFISLLMNIQEKRRQLSLESIIHSNSSLFKKRNRKSLINFSTESNNSTHLTTVIPINSEIEYTIEHLQILNSLLKAINEDSHQVPELLTNYILKVVCPS